MYWKIFYFLIHVILTKGDEIFVGKKKKPHKEPLFGPDEYVEPAGFALDKVLDRVATRLMDTMDREEELKTQKKRRAKL